jgi:hypothetical protein
MGARLYGLNPKKTNVEPTWLEVSVTNPLFFRLNRGFLFALFSTLRNDDYVWIN